MRDWFSIDDMMKDRKAVLQVPRMTSEENSFVATVEDVQWPAKILRPPVPIITFIM
ncbi:10588_t:CDS:1, partial [Paraglomus occultum]